MTPLQKAALAVSEARSALLALPADADADAIEPAEKRLRDAEAQHRKAIVAAGEAESREAESPPRRALAARCEVRHFLREAVTGEAVTGPERDLRQAVIGDGGEAHGVIPWDLLLPPDPPADPEARADMHTPAPDTSTLNQQSIIARVFARSVSAFLGVGMPTVPVGEAAYPILAAGHDPAVVAPGMTHGATPARFDVTTAEPRRLTGRYQFRVEDLAKFRGMEEALRADLRAAMTAQLDATVLNSAADPTGFLATLADPDPQPTTVFGFADLLSAHVSGVDGLYAGSLRDCRMLIGPDTYRVGAALFNPNGDIASTDYLLSRSGGLLSSKHVPAPDATTKIQPGIVHGTGGGGRAFAPMWSGGPRLIRDPYSGAAEGEITITSVALFDFVIVSAAPWRQVSFKTAATA